MWTNNNSDLLQRVIQCPTMQLLYEKLKYKPPWSFTKWKCSLGPWTCPLPDFMHPWDMTSSTELQSSSHPCLRNSHWKEHWERLLRWPGELRFRKNNWLLKYTERMHWGARRAPSNQGYLWMGMRPPVNTAQCFWGSSSTGAWIPLLSQCILRKRRKVCDMFVHYSRGLDPKVSPSLPTPRHTELPQFN